MWGMKKVIGKWLFFTLVTSISETSLIAYQWKSESVLVGTKGPSRLTSLSSPLQNQEEEEAHSLWPVPPQGLSSAVR